MALHAESGCKPAADTAGLIPGMNYASSLSIGDGAHSQLIMTEVRHPSAKYPPAQDTFAAHLAKNLGLDSFRGRFIYMLVIAAVFLLATAWITEKQIGKATQEGIDETAEHQDAIRILRYIANELWTAETALRHSTGLDVQVHTQALEHINNAISRSVPLPDINSIKHTPFAEQSVRELVISLNKLREEIARLRAAKPSPGKLQDSTTSYFDRARTTRLALENAIAADSTEDMHALARQIGNQLRSFWFVSMIGIVVFASGFFLFEYTIRRPLAHISRALKAEAEGANEVQVPQTRTQETDNLISAFTHMRQQIHARQQRLETILDNAAEGIITFDAAGRIESFNKAAERLFGYTENEVVGKDLSLIVPPQLREKREDYLRHFLRTELQRLIGHEGEVTGRHKDGATFHMALKISAMVLEGRQLYTGLVADISERKAMLDHLKDMAEHDGLTGLYNRSYFQQELERVVERAKRAGGICCALLYIDLDNFKYINDTLGHTAGDRLIVEIASLLSKRARKSDLIARIGGDEFSVLLFDTTPILSVQVAESFRARLADYIFKCNGEMVDIGCSIGVTAISPSTTSATAVLSQADIACHLAKRGGRNRVHLYNPEDDESIAAMSLDMGWSRRIKEAIENDRFVLARQPIVNTATREIESHEILIRMLDDRNELIMPSGFLSAAERFGLSADIDKWVIQHAIDDLSRMHKASSHLRYAINLSGSTLTTPGICELIEDRIKANGLDPSSLTFEVTETVAISDMAAAEIFLSRLRSMGCHTALDDFGSGMASFAYLKDLPISSVKIDGRFVKNLDASPIDQAMVKAMNEIAHALNKKTIAEFVENEDSFKMLAAFGIDYAQGYFLGRPELSPAALSPLKEASGKIL